MHEDRFNQTERTIKPTSSVLHGAASRTVIAIDVKNVFYVFYPGHVFLRFLTFFIFPTFFIFKNVH